MRPYNSAGFATRSTRCHSYRRTLIMQFSRHVSLALAMGLGLGLLSQVASRADGKQKKASPPTASKEKEKTEDADRDSTFAHSGILSTVAEPPGVLVGWSF